MPPPITLPITVMSGWKPGMSLGIHALRAAQRHAEAGHHLVEHQQRAVLVHSSRQRFMKGTLARTKFMLPAIGSIITQASSGAVQGEGLFQLRDVVVFEHQRVLHHFGRHAGAGGLPKVARPEPALTSSASAWPW
jgi:hypothetical protein